MDDPASFVDDIATSEQSRPQILHILLGDAYVGTRPTYDGSDIFAESDEGGSELAIFQLRELYRSFLAAEHLCKQRQFGQITRQTAQFDILLLMLTGQNRLSEVPGLFGR